MCACVCSRVSVRVCVRPRRPVGGKAGGTAGSSVDVVGGGGGRVYTRTHEPHTVARYRTALNFVVVVHTSRPRALIARHSRVSHPSVSRTTR